jgi:nucleoside-diphosphate-sugar epimerase
MSAVLVTGGSGFVGSHCILELLAAGHTVRTTVRQPQRAADVLAMLKTGGAEPRDRLSFFVADLAGDAGWAEAVGGCDYVLHVASPIPPTLPQHEDELIAKARGLLGWKPRSSEDAIVASAESLLRLGLLKDTVRQAA